MSIESISRGFNPEAEKPNPEDPYGRGIEASGRFGIEDQPERENLHWLAGIINPEKVEKARDYPLCESWSDEYIVYQFLLGHLVESGGDMSPTGKARLRNLVGVHRVAIFPNLTQDEQESLIEWSQATTFDAKSLEYEINDDAIEDIRWLWDTFNFTVPDQSETRRLLGELPDK